MYQNYDLSNIVTPVNANKFEYLLKQCNYDPEKTKYVVQGFKEGFSLGYEGNEKVKLRSPNLILRVGSEIELWNKMMKEIKEKRFAGPYQEIPFEYYTQSPVGLVPKDNRKNTRLIFHLSYPRRGTTSVNANTPKHLCFVKYPDFSLAVQHCLQEGRACYCGKSDAKAAFRNLPILSKYWRYLVMKAKNPITGKWEFFVDKCLPFGSSISCAVFQKVSDTIAFIVKVKSGGKVNVNYLDDFLFIALFKVLCNSQVELFLAVCNEICFPVALEKTFWASTSMTFLGFLIDTIKQVVAIPWEKIERALQMIEFLVVEQKGKVTVLQVQKLCGFLNFLCRCIVPGRPFTTRLYSLTSSAAKIPLKQHHHIRFTSETKLDLEVWKLFLSSSQAYYRPFIDYSVYPTAVEMDWYMDAAKSDKRGCGGYHRAHWFVHQWSSQFIKDKNPSIEFLELFALTVGVVLWLPLHKNCRLTLFCDNESVCKMVRKLSSSCKNCMKLIQIITLQGLINNTRVFTEHV